MNSKILLAIVFLIVAFGAFTFWGSKKAPVIKQPEPVKSQPTNDAVNIVLTNSGYSPKEVTVKAGTRIIWINKSGKNATVSSDDHPTHKLYPFLNLGEFANGSSLQVVVEKAGKYTYHNHYDATVTGNITAE